MRPVIDFLKGFFLLPKIVIDIYRQIERLNQNLKETQLEIGRIQSKLNQDADNKSLRRSEFKVFSQWNEDGIIQHLVNTINLPRSRQKFIEFGVQDFLESNCRFLMMKDNWSGLVIDGSKENIQKIKANSDFWKYDLTAVEQFLTKDNINETIQSSGYTGPVGILSIDIDGNDYWVWDSITCVNPAIVIVEYNCHFGPIRDVSVPYDPKFDRFEKHHSGTYWGASISAFCRLASAKGFFLAGANSTGINLFFVSNEFKGVVPDSRIEDEFVPGKFRDNRDANGKMLFGDFKSRVEGIKGTPVWDFSKNSVVDF